MFNLIGQQFNTLFQGLFTKSALTSDDISETLRSLRLILLEADVSFPVAKEFIETLKKRVLSEEFLKELSSPSPSHPPTPPSQRFFTEIQEQLSALLGKEEVPLSLSGTPSVILFCGLQGAGKTTSVGKIAHHLKTLFPTKRTLVVACDLQRPAAIEQLHLLAQQVGVDTFLPSQVEPSKATTPVYVAHEAFVYAKKNGYDHLLIDTAGRLDIDQTLMEELQQIVTIVRPEEVLFVANAMMGQQAANIAAHFNSYAPITGIILSMLDSDAKAGTALSLTATLKRPIKFEGTGEKIADLRPFHPRSMADRILGIGDMINLSRIADKELKGSFKEENQEAIAKRFSSGQLSFEDMHMLLSQISKLGPISKLMGMMPGMGGLNIPPDEIDQQIRSVQALLSSMTPKERSGAHELEHSRRRRIAKGAGVPLDMMNKLIKMQKEFQNLVKSPMAKGMLNSLLSKKNTQSNPGGFPWR